MEQLLNEPLIEYCLKNDELGDPLISKDDIFMLLIGQLKKKLRKLIKQLHRINDFLSRNV